MLLANLKWVFLSFKFKIEEKKSINDTTKTQNDWEREQKQEQKRNKCKE